MNSPWSVRAKVTAMMTVPLVMLVALWLYAVSITLPDALELRSTATVADGSVSRPRRWWRRCSRSVS